MNDETWLEAWIRKQGCKKCSVHPKHGELVCSDCLDVYLAYAAGASAMKNELVALAKGQATELESKHIVDLMEQHNIKEH